MYILFFICKILFMVLTLYVFAKIMIWVMKIDTFTEFKDTIGWLREVRACPDLLIKPVFYYVVVPVFSLLIIDYFTHSPSEFAARTRNHLVIAGIFFKWFFIALTVLGVNIFIWHMYGRLFEESNLMEKYGWLVGAGSMGYGAPNPVLAIAFLTIVNSLFAAGIYYQLSPDTRDMLLQFLEAQIYPQLPLKP